MRLLKSARWLLLALLLALVPASSYAGVFISVGFAPPMLPMYEQPPCPDPGLMWTPGYWAYGEDGYYWVPGAWVPAPYDGALWTPPYWGWSSGMYVFYPGYWGPQVGYYGGVNYGYGYMGVGFVGGMWRGRDFFYNTAVMRVDDRRIHDRYEDRRIVDRYTVDRGSRVAFSGGPGGIRHDPSSQERMAMRDQHIARTSFQAQHENMARGDRNSYARFNGGRPANVVASRPLPGEMHQNPSGMRLGGQSNQNRQVQQYNPGNQNQNRQMQQPNPGNQNQNRQMQQTNPGNQNRQNQQWNNQHQQPNEQYQQRNNQYQRPNNQYQQQNNQYQQQNNQYQRQNNQYQQRNNPSYQSRPAPQARPTPQPRPAPQARPAPAPREQHQVRQEPNGNKNR